MELSLGSYFYQQAGLYYSSGRLQTQAHFTWVWKSGCRGKHKFLFLATPSGQAEHQEFAKGKNFSLPSFNCVPYAKEILRKMWKHLFFDCPFSAWCWRLMQIHWDSSVPLPTRLQLAKSAFGSPIFMELVIVAAWCISTTRNSIIFYGKAPSLGHWKLSLREELSLSLCLDASP